MPDNISREKLIASVAQWINLNADTPRTKSQLARNIFDDICASLLADAPAQKHIVAPNVVVEALDKESGLLFRRYLEIEYDENDNGLRLIGEDISGEPVQIAFLSETALARMHELRGAGPDSPRCHEHDGE